MDIRYYTARQLESELSGNELWNQKYCPITRHRALSIIKNPRTLPDDPVLLVGYLDGEVSGYIAIVPDVLYAGDQSVRIGWLGSWWCDPDPANSMMAVSLLMKAYELYQGFLGGSEAARRADQIIRSSNRFKPFRTTSGYQYMLRFNAGYWIPRKYPGLRPLGWVFRFTDAVMNLVQNTRLRLWKSSHKMDHGLSVEYLRQISDGDTIDFIRQHSHSQLTRRNHDDINAMIKYPTSMATILEDTVKSRYYFSNRSGRFQYMLYRMLDDTGKIMAVVLICVDGNHLMIPFVFNRENTESTVITSVLHHVIDMGIDMMTTYHPGFIELMKRLRVPIAYIKTRSRNSLISKKIKHKPYIEPFMQDGDGA
jgi:hypothetical protein